MVESVKATSGAESVSSGTDAQEVSNATSGAAEKHIEKLLKEKQNIAKGFVELKEKYDVLANEKTAEAERKMLETNQHLKVIELKEQKLKELEGELNNFKTKEVEGRKTLAVLSELRKLGLVDTDVNKEVAFKLFDKSSVEIDPTSNTVLGADLAAKAFYDKYNHIGIFGKKSVGTNNNASTYDNSPKNVKSMSNSERKELLKQSIKNLGE